MVSPSVLKNGVNGVRGVHGVNGVILVSINNTHVEFRDDEIARTHQYYNIPGAERVSSDFSIDYHLHRGRGSRIL